MKQETISIAGADIELHSAGAGDPLLFLHSGQGFIPNHEYVRLLSARRRLIAPSHPGFGRSSLPDWLTSVDDIAHIYLGLLDHLGLERVDVVGCSIGGWVAAEMGVKSPERFRRAVLVAPVGVKIGPPDRLDIPDIFALSQERLDQMLFHDPVKAKVDIGKLSDDELRVMLRNREAMALLCWEPWMHNPKLKHHLHRFRNPTLLLRGASDGLVSAEYAEGYAKLMPNARLETIADSGHALPVERPAAFVERALAFLAA